MGAKLRIYSDNEISKYGWSPVSTVCEQNSYTALSPPKKCLLRRPKYSLYHGLTPYLFSVVRIRVTCSVTKLGEMLTHAAQIFFFSQTGFQTERNNMVHYYM